jgi:hypothetical protein
MSVPSECYSRNFPICWVWAFLVKAILETFQSSLWNILHKEPSYSADWKISRIAFTRNAHTQQIGKFLESNLLSISVPCEGYSRNFPICWVWAFLVKAILETFQSKGYERSLWRLFWKLFNLLSMSVPCEGYSINFPIYCVWAFLVKAIPETFQSVEYERSLWRLLQKLSNLLSMRVPCEGYSKNFQICWAWAFLVKAIPEIFQSVEYSRSLWRLFQKISNQFLE